jgi:hypothetical protein
MTLNQTLDAIARLRDEARKAERVLHRAAAAANRDPAVHGALHRLHRVTADLCMVPVPPTIAKVVAG